jgi:hypothetical protein
MKLDVMEVKTLKALITLYQGVQADPEASVRRYLDEPMPFDFGALESAVDSLEERLNAPTSPGIPSSLARHVRILEARWNTMLRPRGEVDPVFAEADAAYEVAIEALRPLSKLTKSALDMLVQAAVDSVKDIEQEEARRGLFSLGRDEEWMASTGAVRALAEALTVIASSNKG